MKRALILFLFGVAAGAGGLWYYEHHQGAPDLSQAKDSVASEARKVREAIQDKIGDLSTEEIKRELERTGLVVREKATRAGAVLADATANARTTATIKTKLFADLGKTALTINVDTTDGLVTLSGSVNTPEELSKAVQVAMETEGVRKVISTLQIKAANSGPAAK